MIFKIKNISVLHKGQGRKGLNKGLSFPIKDGWQPLLESTFALLFYSSQFFFFIDVLLTIQHSNVVYEYVCHCDSRYVGRTSQRLQDRICQHVPRSIWNRIGQERKQPERLGKPTNSTPHCDSAIVNLYYINQNVHLNVMTINFLFFLKHDPIFIYRF